MCLKYVPAVINSLCHCAKNNGFKIVIGMISHYGMGLDWNYDAGEVTVIGGSVREAEASDHKAEMAHATDL